MRFHWALGCWKLMRGRSLEEGFFLLVFRIGSFLGRMGPVPRCP
jgi:hypothetical protein